MNRSRSLNDLRVAQSKKNKKNSFHKFSNDYPLRLSLRGEGHIFRLTLAIVDLYRFNFLLYKYAPTCERSTDNCVSPPLPLMAGKQASLSSAFRGYPIPKEGPDTGYVSKPGSNPILRGIPLAIAASAWV